MDLFQNHQIKPVYRRHSTHHGFSLIEVLVFSAILSMFFASVAGIAANSLRALNADKNRIYATRYAEEVLEWLQDQKEQDWSTFSGHQGTYCFNTTPVTEWPMTGGCSSYGLNSKYKRDVTLTRDPTATQMQVSIVVSWQEVNTVIKVPVNTVFAVWEK